MLIQNMMDMFFKSLLTKRISGLTFLFQNALQKNVWMCVYVCMYVFNMLRMFFH